MASEYQEKKQAEKEEQQAIRAQIKEEEKVAKEIENARIKAEQEEQRYQKEIEKTKAEAEQANGENHDNLMLKIQELEAKLQEAEANKERALSMAQQTKRGHVYIISNIGSFGDDVYKIGMTRRLEPLDRVKELGDASVPFAFDVHAVIFSENAPQLEHDLHQMFDNRRLNLINNKKEFFKVSLAEIEAFIKENCNADIQFTKLAEAKEYRETLALQHKTD